MVPTLAFSLQDQAETYGAYIGLAAFLGLAVLSLLFFAQARELKRLRDWAGRAPERAQEIEARAVAQAEEALRQTPGTVGPVHPVPKPAAAAAVGSDNGRKPGTPAPIPMGPRPATAAAALAASAAGQATAAWAGPAAAPEEIEEEESATEVTGPDGAPETPPPSTDGEPATTGPEDEAAPPADEQEEAAESAETESADAADEDDETPSETGETAAAADDDGPVRPGNGVPAQPPAVAPPIGIPRATPRPPRPAPAQPLRASGARSATLPPRRGQVAAGRGQGEGTSPARFAIVAVIGVLVLAGGAFGITQLLADDDEPAPPPNRPTDSSGNPGAASAGAGERAAAARPEKVVAVLNGTPIVGLASQTRDKLIAEGYSDEQGMIRTGNNTDQQRQDSVVLFRSGERRQARDVAAILDIDTIEEIDDETQALADGADETNSGVKSHVVVVVGTDQAP